MTGRRVAAVGGALVDGTYHLTSDVLYTGVGGATGVTGLGVEVELADRSPLNCVEVRLERAWVVEAVSRVGQAR